MDRDAVCFHLGYWLLDDACIIMHVRMFCPVAEVRMIMYKFTEPYQPNPLSSGVKNRVRKYHTNYQSTE